ncbi:Uncharacterized protein BM_BM17170 [Brugia malayi]|uniref:Uncharacterized protein n=1 Tax=Brugia malayi TaxID=6279 RepID=A0A4E9FU68_BRUMA|nr:Uncharacterized protein BM_BM17170 [Brugia malayi]VIP00227.1 Uncharacterized protein BM_BM17170 [Brugia malayi]
MAREEFESLCSTVAASLQILPPLISLVQVEIPKIFIAPSLQFRNPFEIRRSKLFEQVQKMRINLMQTAQCRADTNV